MQREKEKVAAKMREKQAAGRPRETGRYTHLHSHADNP
jgi:hypothetical protein